VLEGLAALPGKRSVVEAGAADDSNRLPFLPVPHYKSGLSRTSSCGQGTKLLRGKERKQRW